MKKMLFAIAVLMIFIGQIGCLAYAKSNLPSSVRVAISKYRRGNYTGCLQDMQAICRRNPNAVSYYYIAMVYAKAGKKDEAIKYYWKSMNYSSSKSYIHTYAQKGKTCLENPQSCVPVTVVDSRTDLDKFIDSNNTNLSDQVKRDYEQKMLNNVKNQMNNGKDLDDYTFKKFKDRTMNDVSDNKIAYTEQEVQNAIKVLKDAGVNPADVMRALGYENYSKIQKGDAYQAVSGNYSKGNSKELQDNSNTNVEKNNVVDNNSNNVYNAYNTQASKDLQALRSMFGENNSNENNNDMSNMMMLMQQSGNGKGNYSPEVIQSMMMNSMMMDFAK